MMAESTSSARMILFTNIDHSVHSFLGDVIDSAPWTYLGYELEDALDERLREIRHPAEGWVWDEVVEK